ncbi:PQQ-binding-like beta-propeller repeat protein [Allokutzneria sp. NRRL B-24872]|uniref:nSTAND1 domain-containing NTPase n=1 Tax=Allokutzneria sp. NRRL B-24872 TaxID=1137961 RepID=UPI000A384AFC|nr:PQQ-binding-like beta-propeller repeat protein [Allokutzneria sp. NRRL B-24872]
MPRPERPLAADDSAVARFAAALRELRESAGSPGYRQLAKLAHYSVTTLSDAAGGRKLPSLAVALAYAEACGGDRAEWERRWREADRELLGDADRLAEDGQDSPYRGLAAFREQDAELFFGRDELVTDLVDRLGRDRFLVVAGASGAGKSSLLRAGVAHRVSVDGLAGQQGWRTVVFAPGAAPLARWVERLADALGDVPGDVDARAALTEDPTALPRLVELAGVSLLVVIDQFEEVFGTEVVKEDREVFLAAVLATRGTKRLRMVLSVRADFLGHCARHTDLVDAMRDRHVLVGPMTVPELRSAITEPALRTGCTVEAALLATLVAEAANERGGLPLVSHALLETWRRRRGRVLTLSGYEAAGGIHDAVVRTAEAVYARLGEEEEVAARALFLRLVDASEGILRRRATSAELDRENAINAGVLEAFADARLLTVDAGAVEIAHEALISSWPRLTDWIAEDREGHRVHLRLAVAAADWDELGRDPSALYRGTRLAVAREWAAGDKVVLAARERDFLDAADAAERAEQGLHDRRTRQLRQLVTGLAIALVVAVVAGLIVLKQRQDAIDLQQLALSRQLATQAKEEAPRDPHTAMRRALEAYEAARTEEARSAVLSLASHQANHGVITREPTAKALVAVSPDGSLVATDTPVGVRLWDTRTSAERGELRMKDIGHGLSALAFSRDGTRLSAANLHGGTATWELTSRAVVTETADLGVGMAPELLSPGGDLMVISNRGGGFSIWRTGQRQAQYQLLPGVDWLDTVSTTFSSDGRTLFTSDETGLAAKWDSATGAKLAEFQHGQGALRAIAVAEDGHTVALGTREGRLLLWDSASGRTEVGDKPLPGPISDIAFMPGGASVVVTGGVATTLVRTEDLRVLTHLRLPPEQLVHQIATGKPGTVAVASTDAVVLFHMEWLPMLGQDELGQKSIAFRLDGAVVAAGPRQVFTWALPRPTEPRRVPLATSPVADRMRRVAEDHLPVPARPVLSPDLRLVVARSDDEITLYDPETGEVVGSLPVSLPARLGDMRISADGSRLAVGRDDGSVTVWDLRERRAVATIADVTAEFALNADGTRLARRGEDGIVVWNVDGTPKPTRLPSPGSPYPGQIVFSPDGATLARPEFTAVTLWDAATGALKSRVETGASVVTAVEFSPDGQLLALGHGKGEITVWSRANGHLVTSLTGGHSRTIHALAWKKDGSALASTSWDRDVIVWQLRPEDAVRTLCRILGESSGGELPESCQT